MRVPGRPLPVGAGTVYLKDGDGRPSTTRADSDRFRGSQRSLSARADTSRVDRPGGSWGSGSDELVLAAYGADRSTRRSSATVVDRLAKLANTADVRVNKALREVWPPVKTSSF